MTCEVGPMAAHKARRLHTPTLPTQPRASLLEGAACFRTLARGAVRAQGIILAKSLRF